MFLLQVTLRYLIISIKFSKRSVIKLNIIDKLKVLYLTNKTYIRLTFLLIIIAFSYVLRHGDTKYLVEILKVAVSLLELLLGGV